MEDATFLFYLGVEIEVLTMTRGKFSTLSTWFGQLLSTHHLELREVLLLNLPGHGMTFLRPHGHHPLPRGPLRRFLRCPPLRFHLLKLGDGRLLLSGLCYSHLILLQLLFGFPLLGRGARGRAG